MHNSTRACGFSSSLSTTTTTQLVMGATVLTGIVTKAGFMAKTVTMTVSKLKMHPKLHKSYVRHSKYLVHDPDSVLTIGERIRAQACRPLSARKRFVLLERLGFQHGPEHADASHDDAARLRREKTEASMPAAQREWLEIEKRVRYEVRSSSTRK